MMTFRIPRLAGIAAALAAILLMPSPASAQPNFDVVAVEATPDQATVAPGGQAVIAVAFKHNPTWHIHPHEPVVPPELEGFEPIPTLISVKAPAGVTVGPIQWPESHEIDVAFFGDPVPYQVYSDTAIAYVPLLIGPDVTGPITIALSASFQACDDTTCLPPQSKDLTVTLSVGQADAGAPDPAIFGNFDPGVFATMAAGGSAGAPVADPAPVGPTPTTPDPGNGSEPSQGEAPAISFFGIDLPQGDSLAGIFILVLLAAVGGFILNLTPCVLPVIPIKIMTISQHAATPGKSLALGLWMALGVVAFWVGIGLPVIILATFTDPSRIFGIWWVTLGLGVIIAALSLGLFGVFQITLPQSVYAVNPKADTPWGSFLFGIMTAVLGLPCFGFVAGALLAAAATMPKAATMGVFAGIGVGMAAPYLVLSAKPGWVAKIPRTGPASELVKQVMGLLLLAAAAYFVGSGLIALINDKPYLGKQLHIWAIAILGIAAGGWLIIRTVQISKKPAPKLVFGVVGLVIGAAGLLYALDVTEKARQNWEARQAALAAQQGSGELLPGVWLDYSDAMFKKARDAGKIVVMDFTAEWCINCKALKAGVLNRDPVKSAFAQDDVVLLTVDLTSTSAPGWATLTALGRTGIPLLAIYTPGVDEPWLANNYTGGQVVGALTEAREARERQVAAELWTEYSAEALAAARAAGKTVVLDVFAELDLNTKVISALLFRDRAVNEGIAELGVAAFRVDVTSRKAPGWDLLKDLGQNGVPFVAVYGPRDPTPTIFNAADPEAFLQAVRGAAGGTSATTGSRTLPTGTPGG